MLHRRSTATTLVAVLLPLAAALTSCGFDYPTDRVNTIAAGVNNREGVVDVLGARVVAYADGQGRLIGALVYNDQTAEEPATLEAVEGEDIAPLQGLGVEVPSGGTVNLASDDVESIAVEGEFAAGDVITLLYSFSTGESVSLDVPVVKPCRQYSEIESPEFDAAAADETEAPEETGSTEEEADATYLCDHPTPSAEEEGEH